MMLVKLGENWLKIYYITKSLKIHINPHTYVLLRVIDVNNLSKNYADVC